jgi:hypothetical protein
VNGDPGRRARWLYWRPRIAVAVAGSVLTLVVGAALFVVRLYTSAVSETCEQWSAPELQMETLKSMKARLDTYRADPDPDAEIELTGDELSALLQDEVPYAVRVQIIGPETADVAIAAPQPEGCYNIHYRGHVAVRDGALELVPEALRVGDSNLSLFVAGRTLELDPGRWLGPEGATAVQRLKSLSVRDGIVALRLRDRWMIH